MEPNRRKELTILVNRIIKKNDEAGRKQIDIDDRLFRELRDFIKKETESSSILVDHLLKEAAKAECPTRQLALSLMDYFFLRSHVWRLAVVDKLQEVLVVFCELDILHKPLPPPKEEANELKVDTIKRIKIWHNKFASGYERLQNVPSFLAASKAIDYERASASLLAERKREEEIKKKQEEKAEKISGQIIERFETIRDDATRCLAEISSAIRLLIPDFSKATENEPNFIDDDQPTTSSNTRVHGYETTETVTVFLKHAVPQLKVSKENEALTAAVRDGNAMLTFYRKQILRWLSRLAEVGAKQQHVAPILDLKMRIDAEQSRIVDLKLPESRKTSNSDSDDEDESDFEDVPEKQVEDFIDPTTDSVPLVIMEKLKRKDLKDKLRSTSDSHDDQPGPSKAIHSSRPSIPTLSYGLDLKYWGDEVPKDVEIPRNDADSHRFWKVPEEGETAKELTSVYTSRQMTFIGKGIRPEKPCRARLANGNLCPRMDVKKCPIHGMIVDRDDEGFPVKEMKNVDQQALAEAAQKQDDQEYLRDVEAATGKKLTTEQKAPKKSRTWGRKSREVPQGRQARGELEKKLLDKRAIARVSAHLDAVRKAKIERQYGHQFVHHFSRK